ncbi:hypothetical protein GWK47_037362 [Chionoecetes opilio]|uniref:Uncharacterized protein n=1 Tax=Chionoecetes opilio TaxID=41210 RepID=A0A8J4YF23_CHIOP|nr:hypothetical protein GWK47_037362 [Chionoecetes opilio]
MGQASFTLGEWEVTCRRAEREALTTISPGWGPWMTQLTSLRSGGTFDPFDGGEVGRDHLDPGPQSAKYTPGKWLRLKVVGPFPQKVSISQLVYGHAPTSSLCSVLWVHGSATPSTPAGLRAMLQVQRASPMQARRHHLHQALSLFPGGDHMGPGLRTHFQLPGSAALC